MGQSKRLLSAFFVLMLVVVMAVGCADPNREACKEACQKMKTCDDPENGGSGALNEVWLDSCEQACDEADEIAEDIAECLIKTDCASIQQECGSGGN